MHDLTWGKGEWNMHDFCQKQIAGSAQREAKKSWIPESFGCGDGDDKLAARKYGKVWKETGSSSRDLVGTHK